MKANQFSALPAIARSEGPFYSKMILAFVIVALVFASLPVASVFAASGDEEPPWENANLPLEWKNKLLHLRYEGYFFDRVRFYPADFESQDDLALAQLYLEKYGIALKQANTLVYDHSGFDLEGNVTNERLAYETIHDLAEYLRAMRGLRAKIDEIPGGN
jgi:hypothetical protein